jgi:hypothetical protein
MENTQKFPSNMLPGTRIWVDDLDNDERAIPPGYVHLRTVDEAKAYILQAEAKGEVISLIDLDHDAGDHYRKFGGDYIQLLNWLEYAEHAEGIKRDFTFRIHSMNSVGAQSMRAIIEKNGWKMTR